MEQLASLVCAHDTFHANFRRQDARRCLLAGPSTARRCHPMQERSQRVWCRHRSVYDSHACMLYPPTPSPLPPLPSTLGAQWRPNESVTSPFDGVPCMIHAWTPSFIKLCRPDDAIVGRYLQLYPPTPSPLPPLPSTLGAQWRQWRPNEFMIGAVRSPWRPNESMISPFGRSSPDL